MQSVRTSASHVILCFNSGSSSVKVALYRLGAVEEVQLAHGAVERIGLAGGHLWIRGTDSAALVDVQCDFPAPAAIAGIITAAKDLGLPPPVGIGHRVVHGGLDHTAPVRWEVCRGLAYLGIDLDPQRNAVHADVISTPGSPCTVRVIPTNEDLMIARHTRTLLVLTPAP
jgi:acetate kinase